MSPNVGKSIFDIFDTLRFPLIVSLICIHTVYSFGYSPESINSYVVFRYLFSSLLPRVCVPMFLFISGFLFFYNFGEQFYVFEEKLCRRVNTLLIPFILWNLFQVGYYFVLYFSRGTAIPSDIPTWLSFFYSDQGSGMPINTPLWYLLELMMFAILSPLIMYSFKVIDIFSIIVILIFYLFTDSTIGGYFDPLYFLFYFIGAYGAYKKISFIVPHSTLLSGAVVLLLIISCLFYEDFTKSLYGIRTTILGRALSLCYISIMLFFLFNVVYNTLATKGARWMRYLSVFSFFIFCFHFTFPFNMSDALVDKYFTGYPTYICIGVHACMICFKLLACMSIFLLLQKTCPSILNVLTGNRRSNNSRKNDIRTSNHTDS